MRRRFALLIAFALTFAPVGAEDEPTGVVSYIGSSLEIDTDSGDPTRALPHIEVVDWSQFEACKDKASPDCKFEYAIPYVVEDEARKLERRLSEAWARFDARTAWRVDAALKGSALGCATDKLDPFLGAWDKNPKTLSTTEFCDGNLPETPVIWYPLVCPNFYLDWDELFKRYGEAIAHAYATYYPDYLLEADRAVAEIAPLALYWRGHLTPGMGSTIFPVAGAPSSKWTELIQAAQQKDVRGGAYMTQALPGMAAVREALRNLPGESHELNAPGIQALEKIKTQLMSRGDIFAKPQFWAGMGGGPEPEGTLETATPEEYQVYGVVPIMRVYSQIDTELSPHIPIFWVGCITSTLPPLFVPIPIPMPIVHVASRVHTGWQVVPEGYPIEGIQGDPILR